MKGMLKGMVVVVVVAGFEEDGAKMEVVFLFSNERPATPFQACKSIHKINCKTLVPKTEIPSSSSRQ